MSIDLEELKRLHKEATQGKWEHDYCAFRPVITNGGPKERHVHIATVARSEKSTANADLIIAMHNAFPAIVARLEAADHFINHVEGEAACFLGYGDDGVIGDDNVLRAVRIMHKRKIAADNFYRRIKEISESGDCGKMLEDALAAFDEMTAQGEQ